MQRPLFTMLMLVACFVVLFGTDARAHRQLNGEVNPELPEAAAVQDVAPRTSGWSLFSYSIGLWGDLPYSVLQATTGVPNLIADMNSQNLAFTVYDGDWKAGTPVDTTGTSAILSCVDELYTQQITGYFNALKAPAIYVPGDNEWTDCDKPLKGSTIPTFNSLNRLSFIRKLFFSGKYSQGQKKLKLNAQNDTCLGWAGTNQYNVTERVYKYEPCSENRRWTYLGVTYVTINQVGSCNNLCKEFPDPVEYAVRNAANIKWIQETFAVAKQLGSAGIMIIAQADPGFDPSGFQGGPKRDPISLNETDTDPDGFKDFLTTLRTEVMAFKKPVVYVHGDSHYFMMDKPLLDAAGNCLVQFTRVQTFGDNQQTGNTYVNWVRVDVDATSRNVFTFIPQIVKANSPTQF